MSPARPPKNLGASVRARLLELARRRGAEFQLVLSEFAIERLLYRLGVSSHAERFVLKGAMLFKLWSDDFHRATWDLDLLGRGANTVAPPRPPDPTPERPPRDESRRCAAPRP